MGYAEYIRYPFNLEYLCPDGYTRFSTAEAVPVAVAEATAAAVVSSDGGKKEASSTASTSGNDDATSGEETAAN